MHGTIDIEQTIATADSEYPALFQLFGGYFHQDWHEEYVTTRDAVNAFVHEAPPQAVRAAVEELDRLLAQRLDESALSRLLQEGFDCNYVPQVDEMTNRDWLAQLRDLLGGQR
jgi:CdiI immunity protein